MDLVMGPPRGVVSGTDIINPVLRLAQVFLAHNLLGQANETITTPELYFMWCMLTNVKVHLGYWIAQAHHKITRRHVRHLYACHLLGAYLQRNVTVTIARPQPIITMCDAPDWFDIGFFINSGLVTRVEAGALHFYEVGKAEEAPIEVDQETDVEKTTTKVEKEVKEESTPTEARPTATEEKWQRIIEFMMSKFGDANEKLGVFMELQNENNTKALSLIERMTTLAETNTQIAQQLLSSASTSKGSLPKEASSELTPSRVLRKRKETTSQPPSTAKRTRYSGSQEELS